MYNNNMYVDYYNGFNNYAAPSYEGGYLWRSSQPYEGCPYMRPSASQEGCPYGMRAADNPSYAMNPQMYQPCGFQYSPLVHSINASNYSRRYIEDESLAALIPQGVSIKMVSVEDIQD